MLYLRLPLVHPVPNAFRSPDLHGPTPLYHSTTLHGQTHAGGRWNAATQILYNPVNPV